MPRPVSHLYIGREAAMKPEIEVLIVGAGPTGLVLALWLSHLGVKVRIVDKAAEPGTTSRALVVHARILEFYDQINLAREIADPGLKMGAATLWVAGKEKGRIVFGDMGKASAPSPTFSSFHRTSMSAS
jgi:2-polyprenyl-6-methoxyphenol hydroxylase-like FAD-dependent oxidoreductase